MKKSIKLKVGDLATKSGVARSTIQYYLREGILPAPDKTGQTMAYYGASYLQLLENINKIKMEYLKNNKSSRVPLSYIKERLKQNQARRENTGDPVEKQSLPRGSKRRELTRQQLIEKAVNIYLTQGYYNTRIENIAREVGVSLPTFYKYFSDKRTLFIEVIEHVINRYMDEVRNALSGEVDFRKRTRIMSLHFNKNYPMFSEILNQLKAGVAINDQWAKEKLLMVYEKLTRGLIRQLNRGMDEGLIRKMNSELLAFFIIAIAEAEVNRSVLDNKYTTQELILFAADLQYNGFLTRKGRELLLPYLSNRS